MTATDRSAIEAWCDQHGFTLVPRRAAQPFGGLYDDPQGAVERASPALPTPSPINQLVAEVLTVDMNAPLNAVDRLRALAGGSRDIAFEPSDADEILEKLEALAALAPVQVSVGSEAVAIQALKKIEAAALGGYLTPDLCAEIVTSALSSASEVLG